MNKNKTRKSPVTSGSKISRNLCSRCGQERILVSTYTELVGVSTVTFREMTCSDPDCQKKVDALLEKDRLRRTQIEEEQARRKRR